MAPARTMAAARLRRAIREFLLVPACVVAAYALLGVLAVAVDKSPPAWLAPLRHDLTRLISRDAATSLLSGIATSVVTVTSITFSVLLLAVQQTASSMTPAVFDQFLRRRTNQVYLGMFVGLTLFSFLVLSSIGRHATPAFGAATALVLTIGAFLALVVLIYSTVDQMRPSSVTQVIHDRALQARERERELIARTRRAPAAGDHAGADVLASADGYVTAIDLDAIATALGGRRGEVVLDVTLGEPVAFGQRLATITDGAGAGAGEAVSAVAAAIRLDRERDLDIDASFAVEELGNIAWTALSTSKHNPQTGRQAIDRLRDIGARWSAAGPPPPAGEVLPVVYRDEDLDRLVDTLLDLVVVCGESRQVESCSHALRAVHDVASALPPEVLARADRPLAQVLATVARHPLTRHLEQSLAALALVLERRGCEAAAGAAEAVLVQLRDRGARLEHAHLG